MSRHRPHNPSRSPLPGAPRPRRAVALEGAASTLAAVNVRDRVESDTSSATVEGVQWRSRAIRAPAPALQPTRQKQHEKDQQDEATGSAVVHDVSS